MFFEVLESMRTRWIIHSGGEVLGPWSASRIREELRAGRIDAFDLVGMESGSEKRPLVDVDEIFNPNAEHSKISSSKQIEQKDIAEVAAVILQSAAGANSTPLKQQHAEPLAEKKLSTDYRPPRAFEALAAPNGIHPREKIAVDHGPALAKAQGAPQGSSGHRRYVLWIPGQRAQGPFSSREILTLWYARKVPPFAMVQRNGDARRIDIAKFARFYERATPSGVAFLGHARLAEGVKDSSMAWIILALLLGSGIIYGAIYLSYHRTPHFYGLMSLFSASPDQEIAPQGGDRVSFVERSGSTEVDLAVSVPAPATGTATGTATGNVNVPRLERRAGASTMSAPQAPVMPPSVAKAPQKRPPRPKQVPRAARQPASVVPDRRNLGQSRPIQRQTPAPVERSKVSPAPGLVDGATVTLSRYRFDINMLKKCEAKCKIPMAGPQGPITAVFFKEAFADVLASKASDVTITGTVRRDPASGQISIFIQTVR